MNFKYMDKEAWLLDEDILYKGIVKRKWFKHYFIPHSHAGGFSFQFVKRNDIGKILFRNDNHIVYMGLGHIKRIFGDYIDESQLKSVIEKVKEATGKDPIILGKRP
jgi:hypothetical protein